MSGHRRSVALAVIVLAVVMAACPASTHVSPQSVEQRVIEAVRVADVAYVFAMRVAGEMVLAHKMTEEQFENVERVGDLVLDARRALLLATAAYLAAAKTDPAAGSDDVEAAMKRLSEQGSALKQEVPGG